MIRCVLVDDEQSAIENLKRIIQWYCEDDLKVLGSANNLSDALELIGEQKPQLLFLDVEIGDETGFMLLEKLRVNHPDLAVILTTAHQEYAILALRKEVFDFLPKPIDPEDLQNAIARLKDRPSSFMQPSLADTISLPMQSEVIVCKIGEIIRCESERNYTHFFLEGGTRYLVSKHLGSFEEKLLPNGFFRPHKSHLINLAFLKSYVKTEGGYILMQDGSQIPVARNQRPALFKLLGL